MQFYFMKFIVYNFLIVPAASHLSSPWQPYPSGAVNPCLQPDVYSQSYTGAVPPSLPPFNHEAFAGAMQQPSWSYNHPEPNTMFMNTVPTYPTWEHVPVHHPALGGTMPVLYTTKWHNSIQHFNTTQQQIIRSFTAFLIQ